MGSKRPDEQEECQNGSNDHEWYRAYFSPNSCIGDQCSDFGIQAITSFLFFNIRVQGQLKSLLRECILTVLTRGSTSLCGVQ